MDISIVMDFVSVVNFLKTVIENLMADQEELLQHNLTLQKKIDELQEEREKLLSLEY